VSFPPTTGSTPQSKVYALLTGPNGPAEVIEGLVWTAHAIKVDNPTNGAHTYFVKVANASSGSNLTWNAGATLPSYILVEDIGV
jgi:hypothetical protein